MLSHAPQRIRSFRRLMAFFIIALLVSLNFSLFDTPTVVSAQSDVCNSAIPIRYGQSVEGSISNSAVAVAYCFNGVRNDSVLIAVTQTSGTLDPLVAVANPTLTTTYASNDDASSTNRNSAVIFRLPSSGRFVILVSRKGGRNGNTTGRFRMTLAGAAENSARTATPRPTARPTTPPSSGSVDVCNSATPIRYGQSIEGTISNSAFAVAYCFNGVRNDAIVIAVTRTSGTLDPLVTVANPTLTTTYASNDDASSTNRNSAVIYRLPSSGRFVVLVSRKGGRSGTTTGGFRMTLAGAAENSARPTVQPTSPPGSSGGGANANVCRQANANVTVSFRITELYIADAEENTNDIIAGDESTIGYGLGVVQGSTVDFGNGTYFRTWDRTGLRNGRRYTGFSTITRTVRCGETIVLGVAGEEDDAPLGGKASLGAARQAIVLRAGSIPSTFSPLVLAGRTNDGTFRYEFRYTVTFR